MASCIDPLHGHILAGDNNLVITHFMEKMISVQNRFDCCQGKREFHDILWFSVVWVKLSSLMVPL